MRRNLTILVLSLVLGSCLFGPKEKERDYPVKGFFQKEVEEIKWLINSDGSKSILDTTYSDMEENLFPLPDWDTITLTKDSIDFIKNGYKGKRLNVKGSYSIESTKLIAVTDSFEGPTWSDVKAYISGDKIEYYSCHELMNDSAYYLKFVSYDRCEQNRIDSMPIPNVKELRQVRILYSQYEP